MRNDTDNRAALLIVGSHILQALCGGDSAAAEGHMEVYRAIRKAAERKSGTGER